MVQYTALPSGLPHNVYPASSSPSEETSRLTGLSCCPNDLGYCIFQNDSTSLMANRANRSKLPSSVFATRPVGAGLSGLGPLGPSDTVSPLTFCGLNRAESGCPATTVCPHADTKKAATTEISLTVTPLAPSAGRSIGGRGCADADTGYRASGLLDEHAQPNFAYGANLKLSSTTRIEPMIAFGAVGAACRAAGDGDGCITVGWPTGLRWSDAGLPCLAGSCG